MKTLWTACVLCLLSAPLVVAADPSETAGWTIVIENEFPVVDNVMIVQGWYDPDDKEKTHAFSDGPISIQVGGTKKVPAEAMPKTLREARQIRWWVDLKSTEGVEPTQMLDSTKEDDQKKTIRYRLD